MGVSAFAGWVGSWAARVRPPCRRQSVRRCVSCALGAEDVEEAASTRVWLNRTIERGQMKRTPLSCLGQIGATVVQSYALGSSILTGLSLLVGDHWDVVALFNHIVPVALLPALALLPVSLAARRPRLALITLSIKFPYISRWPS
jgi:hypothetical protein